MAVLKSRKGGFSISLNSQHVPLLTFFFHSNSDQGPPSSQRSVNADGSCGNGWVCEHRWRQITNMVPFAAAVEGNACNIYEK